MSAVRWWRNGYQHHGSLDRLEDPVRNIRRRPHHRSGSHVTSIASHHHPRLSGYDQIKFVRPRMHMSFLRLAGLEAVQAHKHLPARKQVRLGAFVTAERGQSLYRFEVVGHTPPQTQRIS